MRKQAQALTSHGTGRPDYFHITTITGANIECVDSRIARMSRDETPDDNKQNWFARQSTRKSPQTTPAFEASKAVSDEAANATVVNDEVGVEKSDALRKLICHLVVVV